MASPETEARIRALPKVELHQHVDGSIPAEVTWELMRHYRLHPVETLEECGPGSSSSRKRKARCSPLDKM